METMQAQFAQITEINTEYCLSHTCLVLFTNTIEVNQMLFLWLRATEELHHKNETTVIGTLLSNIVKSSTTN